jgi:15-cis-phytoene synthase
MDASNDKLRASYDFCRRFSRRAGSNFYLGFLLLPREKQQAMYALYAFMRHTDDLVDALPADPHCNIDAAENRRREHLRIWREALNNSLAGAVDPTANLADISPKAIPNTEATAARLLPALVDVVHKHRIPSDCLFDVLDGVEMDLQHRQYETFQELMPYCRRVASAVGLACIHIWGFRGKGTPDGDAAIEFARRAGIALQLTNILRDLKTDAETGRIYLPLEDLRQCAYSVEELKKGVVNQAFYRLMDMEIDRARQFYREGCELLDFLDRDGQRIFGMMTTVYRSLLEKIARRPEEVFSRPVKLCKFNQIVLFLYWMFMPSWMAAKMYRGSA